MGGGDRSYKPLSNLEVSRARPNNEHLYKTKILRNKSTFTTRVNANISNIPEELRYRLLINNI